MVPLAVALAACARAAHATPIDDPHVGSIGFGGPTTDDLSALYWNPAALGLRSGLRFMVAASAQIGTRTVERASIDPATGAPGDGRTFAPVEGEAERWPRRFPIGPGGFLAAAVNLGNRVSFAFGTYSPFVVRERFPAAADGGQPARYHAVETDLSTVALTPGIAIRIASGLRIGVATAFLLSNGKLVVDHDTGAPSGSAGAARRCGDGPCGAENPQAAARYHVVSNSSFLDSAFSFALGLGVHYERPRWGFGVGYMSGPWSPWNSAPVEIQARSTRIDLPPRSTTPTICNQGPDPCVSSLLSYHLPSMVSGGFEHHLNPRWDVGVQVRWIDLSVHDAIRIRAVGPAGGRLRSEGVPEQLVLYRGMRDVWEVRLRAMMKLADPVQFSLTLRGETPAVPREAMSPAAFGGMLLEPSLAVRVRIASWLAASAGYAIGFAPPVTTTTSLHDPRAAAACEATGGDLESDPCRVRQQGRARPTAAGRYQALSHSFAASVSLQF